MANLENLASQAHRVGQVRRAPKVRGVLVARREFPAFLVSVVHVVPMAKMVESLHVLPRLWGLRIMQMRTPRQTTVMNS